jgi:hypothetical protein
MTANMAGAYCTPSKAFRNRVNHTRRRSRLQEEAQDVKEAVKHAPFFTAQISNMDEILVSGSFQPSSLLTILKHHIPCHISSRKTPQQHLRRIRILMQTPLTTLCDG